MNDHWYVLRWVPQIFDSAGGRRVQSIDCCVIARLMHYQVIHQKHVTISKSHKSVKHAQQVL